MESRRIKLTHKDPGDRFIAATALVYDLVLVTADRELLQCPALKTV
jgi:PIN domain nuclease of toxin-antitoxin system